MMWISRGRRQRILDKGPSWVVLYFDVDGLCCAIRLAMWLIVGRTMARDHVDHQCYHEC